MTVNEFAAVLQNPALKLDKDGWYRNKSGQQGYWANVCLNGLWYWYQVSNTDIEVSPADVATAITSPSRQISRSNSYKAGRGFEATVITGDHSYMLGHGTRG